MLNGPYLSPEPRVYVLPPSMTISPTTELLPSSSATPKFTPVVLPTAITLLPSPSPVSHSLKMLTLSRATLEGLSEEEKLDLCAFVSEYAIAWLSM